VAGGGGAQGGRFAEAGLHGLDGAAAVGLLLGLPRYYHQVVLLLVGGALLGHVSTLRGLAQTRVVPTRNNVGCVEGVPAELPVEELLVVY